MSEGPAKYYTPRVANCTRPEAREYAVKNRGTKPDWFSHDPTRPEAGENPYIPRGRGQRPEGDRVSEKFRKQKPDWFQHDPSRTDITTSPVGRGKNEEAVSIKTKVYGDHETWYKHDDNRNYSPPKKPLRVTAVGAERNAIKNKPMGDVNWYKHDGSNVAPYTKPPEKGTDPRLKENADNFKNRKSDWFEHDPNSDYQDPIPPPRVASPEAASNAHKIRGNTPIWYNADENYGYSSPKLAPRLVTEVAENIAEKNRGTLDKWLKPDDNRNYETEHCQARVNPEAEANATRNRGQMGALLVHKGGSRMDQSYARAVKPEAAEYAEKSRGNIDKTLKQDYNRGYESAKPVARVKPEAEEIAKRNKGVMNETLAVDAYPNAPAKQKPKGRAVKKEAQITANANKGNRTKELIDDYGNLGLSVRPIQRIKPEAEEFANKHKPTVQNLFHSYGALPISGRPVPRVKHEAQDFANKNNKSSADKAMYNKSSRRTAWD